MLRGLKGSFSKAVRAARNVVDAGIELATAFTPNRFNIHEFSGYADMIYGLGSRQIRMMPLLRLGRTLSNKDMLIPSAEQMLDFQWAVRRKTHEYINKGMMIEWGDPLEHLHLFPNNTAKLFILELHSNGNVGISAYLPLVFGNALTTPLRVLWEQGLKDVWRHPIVKRYAEQLVDLEDLEFQEPLPWKGEHLYVDLSRS
jgi:MoaA/NifB/PqqE/SkfB family radical SAM enzyme